MATTLQRATARDWKLLTHPQLPPQVLVRPPPHQHQQLLVQLQQQVVLLPVRAHLQVVLVVLALLQQVQVQQLPAAVQALQRQARLRLKSQPLSPRKILVLLKEK